MPYKRTNKMHKIYVPTCCCYIYTKFSYNKFENVASILKLLCTNKKKTAKILLCEEGSNRIVYMCVH